MRMLTGLYLEGWEITQDKMTWHVRPGMYFHEHKPLVLEPRGEITAYDVAADIIWYCNGAAGGYAKGVILSPLENHVTATDRYTVVIDTPRYDGTLLYLIGFEDRALLSPIELEESESWDEQIGSGPFMLDEYVVGSHMYYVRNPNYWDTTTIDGVEYEIPFIDDLMLPIIPDESTAVSALRTGKLDYMQPVPFPFWDTLDKTAPGIESAKYLSHLVYCPLWKCDVPPFDNINVRRAMQIGTDMMAFQALTGVPWEMPKHAAPFYTGDPDLYTPLEDLPADIQILYTYNPELAMEMLALEGYPDGFKMELMVSAISPAALDRAALAKDMWDKIGVEVEIKAYDAVTVWDKLDSSTFKDCNASSWETANALNELHRRCETGNVRNWGRYSNTEVDDLIHAASATFDVAEQNRLMKEAGLIIMYEQPLGTWTVDVEGFYWWPWLKNYFGEKNVRDHDSIYALVARMWIDEDLKAEMGH